jgi:histidine triad (HIT) family protein
MADNPEQQCIFCKIAKGEIQSFVIYSDEKCIAFLDINPASKGHVLLIPKEHHALMPMMPEELAAHLGQVSKHLSVKAMEVFEAKGATIFTAAGAAAGQNAPHVIMHIIPRYDGDEVSMALPGNKISQQELDKIRNALLPKLEKEFGAKTILEEKRIEEPKEKLPVKKKDESKEKLKFDIKNSEDKK